jgi:DNA-binding XRE family transcriptional regulator
MRMLNMTRGRPSKLSLELKMSIRRRVQEWKGRRGVIYDTLAKETGVSRVTIQRIFLGY